MRSLRLVIVEIISEKNRTLIKLSIFLLFIVFFVKPTLSQTFTNTDKLTFDLTVDSGIYFIHLITKNGEQRVFKVFKN